MHLSCANWKYFATFSCYLFLFFSKSGEKLLWNLKRDESSESEARQEGSYKPRSKIMCVIHDNLHVTWIQKRSEIVRVKFINTAEQRRQVTSHYKTIIFAFRARPINENTYNI